MPSSCVRTGPIERVPRERTQSSAIDGAHPPSLMAIVEDAHGPTSTCTEPVCTSRFRDAGARRVRATMTVATISAAGELGRGW
jgi:hypothetical protein